MKAYLWKDKCGIVHKIPDKTCVICKHSIDIFLDPLKGNEIYCVVCGITNDSEDPRKCKMFEYSEEAENLETMEVDFEY